MLKCRMRVVSILIITTVILVSILRSEELYRIANLGKGLRNSFVSQPMTLWTVKSQPLEHDSPTVNHTAESNNKRGVTKKDATDRTSAFRQAVEDTTVRPMLKAKFEERKRNTFQWFPESKRYDFPLSTLPEPYLINNKVACASVVNLDYVFLVSSAPSHMDHRKYIRDTWGNHTLYKPKEVRVVFVIGRIKAMDIQQSIDLEIERFGDILQGTFDDSYPNLIHKTVLGLRWASENCMHSKIIVKMDDDVFVNMFRFLYDANNTYDRASMEMFCYSRANGTSPIQRDMGKWKIGFEYFKNMTYFPFVHCNGFFVVMTADLIPVLYKSATETPILILDDVWLTGILPTKLGNVTVTKLKSLSYDDVRAFGCFNSTTERCGITAVNLSGRVDKYKMWNNCVSNQHGR